MKIKNVFGVFIFVFLIFGLGSSAQALNSLQLYLPDGTYSYDLEQTWVIAGTDVFTLKALAADSDFGGTTEGDAFDGSLTTAYLAVSLGEDLVEIPFAPSFGTLTINGTPYPSADWAWGTPDIPEGTSISPHSIFETYYTVYAFDFGDYPGDGIWDTQNAHDPGTYDKWGWREDFVIDISGIDSTLVGGVHFDLYTLDSSGSLQAFAPYSHDAQAAAVPEPKTMFLLGTGLVGLVRFRRKIKK